jgi:hypothetical protein
MCMMGVVQVADLSLPLLRKQITSVTCLDTNVGPRGKIQRPAKSINKRSLIDGFLVQQRMLETNADLRKVSISFRLLIAF